VPQQSVQARPLIGAHVPMSGKISRLAYATAVGAEVIQVFAANPRAWATAPGDPAADAAFRQAGLPVFVHAPYLINLGSADELTASRSVSALGHSIRRAEEMGARGVVVHTGSAVGADRGTALRQVAAGLVPLPQGTITRQSPAAKTPVTPNETVTIWVSTGPPQVGVPDVDGMSVAQARQVLRQAGFHVAVDRFGPFDKVFEYSPNGQAAKGSTVTVYTGF
jgi:hypothetical protein